MELDAPLMASTCSIDQVAGRSLDPYMPAGKDAGRLRSLMNECQMLLHADDQSGVVNSLWFWGLGRLPAITRKPLEIFCNTLLCKSFIGACDADSEPSDTSLFTTSGCLDGRQYGDMDRWISGLSETEARLRELLEGEAGELTAPRALMNQPQPLLPPAAVASIEEFAPGDPVEMGVKLGRLG